MPLVSIITPSYNQAPFLEQAICSVLDQDGAEIEYLVVDGGSTDGSLEIIQRYASRLAWWVSEPDRGQAEAINKGLGRARGEYIAWLNSDDYYLPGAVQSAVSALEARPESGMVFGDAYTVDAAGNLLNPLVFGDWGLDELMRFRIICQPSVFMRRATLEAAGYLDESYHYLLDHHLWLRLARLGPIQHYATPWSAARHHSQAKNVSQAARFGEEAFRILEWMEEQPDLAARLAQSRRQVEAGAYRLKARYLLDGEQAAPALGAYWQALVRNPRFTLQHWHRIVYAGLSLVGLRAMGRFYYRLRRRQALD